MNFLSIFTGIGMFDYGLELAGMTCSGQIEIDDFKTLVLQKHWPKVERFRDVYQFKGTEVGPVRVVCAGYPCQGESYSGERRGTEDDRWLWPEVLRIIKVKKPTWFIGENVVGHESMGLRIVISDLEAAGYSVRSFIIPSAACGLPTVERHVWVVAATDEERLQGYFENAIPWVCQPAGEFQRGSKEQFERWSLPGSRVCGVGEGGANWMDRLKAIGDSIPPQIPEIIGCAIIGIEKLMEEK